MIVKKATLRGFDPQGYTALVQVEGSEKSYLEAVPAARNLPAVEMVVGRSVVVAFCDENNPRSAVVIAVYV
jgi:hypothetical protein